MDINVSYHWTNLDYRLPSFKTGNWGPVATAAIEIHAELPTAEGYKELYGEYKHLTIPITGTKDPRQEIIEAIEQFGRDHSITIEMDCLNGKNMLWDEPF